MVLLAGVSEFYCKLKNGVHRIHSYSHIHRREHEAAPLQASFHDFQTTLATSLIQLPPIPKPGSDFFFSSSSWTEPCFALMALANNAFAKLIDDIDYPPIKWRDAFKYEYLDYNSCLLGLLDAITSSSDRLILAMMALFRAIRLMVKKDKQNLRSLATKRLGAVTTATKRKVMRQALIEVESIVFWVCGVMLAALLGGTADAVYLRMRNIAQGFSKAYLSNLGSSSCQEVNDSATCIAAADREIKGASKDLKRRLELSEKLMGSFRKEVDYLLRKLLAGAHDLVDRNGHQKKCNQS